MEIILLERIEKLGQMGDVVEVKPGFARNFLLPQKKALRATKDNRKVFEEQRAQLEAANLEQRGEAEKVADKMEGLSIKLIRQAGEAGQLYGSVTVRDISGEVSEAGFTIERTQVQLAHPIKTLGIHQVRVDLHPEVSTNINVNVARSEEEANIQSKTGSAVVRRGEEDESMPSAAEAEAEAVAPAMENSFEEVPEELSEAPDEKPSE